MALTPPKAPTKIPVAIYTINTGIATVLKGTTERKLPARPLTRRLEIRL